MPPTQPEIQEESIDRSDRGVEAAVPHPAPAIEHGIHGERQEEAGELWEGRQHAEPGADMRVEVPGAKREQCEEWRLEKQGVGETDCMALEYAHGPAGEEKGGVRRRTADQGCGLTPQLTCGRDTSGKMLDVRGS